MATVIADPTRTLVRAATENFQRWNEGRLPTESEGSIIAITIAAVMPLMEVK